MNTLNTLVDRLDTTNIKNLDRMIAELSPHMTEFEVDRAVDLLNTLAHSKFDINLTVDDAASQLKILFGSERYEIIKAAWSRKNQHLIKEGRVKYIRLTDGAVFDGLDPEDHPAEYAQVYM